MNLAAKCLSYAVIVVGLPLGLGLGARWLVSPDPTAARVVTAPPLPARIADSIARRQEPLPAAITEKPAAAAPVLLDANVALHPSPPRRISREFQVRQPNPKPRLKPGERLQAQSLPITPTPAVVTTARSDVPY